MDITVEKCGIRVNPPALIVIYRSDGKLRQKTMPLRNFRTDSNVEFVGKELKKRHQLDQIPLVKIEKLLRLLQELSTPKPKTEAFQTVEKEFEIKLNEDLNKLPTNELELQKQLMDSLFLKNQIKRDDKDFVYDNQIDFSGEKEESTWDLETDNNFWD